MKKRPIYDMLKKCSDRQSLHMPGHGGSPPFNVENLYLLDTTEIDHTDDLYKPIGAIKEAENLLAIETKTDTAILLHDGSSVGIHTAMLYGAKPGDKVIIPRNCHMSVINACILYGFIPVYIPCKSINNNYTYIEEKAAIETIKSNTDAKLILIVSPDYYGACLKINDIAKVAHENNMILICDQAHGAHLNWDEEIKNAGAHGADIFVQSAHKTLPALTSGAWLLANKVDEDKLRSILRMLQTSSPSFINMMSCDDARAWMSEYGKESLILLKKALDNLRNELFELNCFDSQKMYSKITGHDYDRSRLVIGLNQNAFAIQKMLSNNKVDIEMADLENLICIFSLNKDVNEKQVLIFKAVFTKLPLKNIPNHNKIEISSFEIPERKYTPSDARNYNSEWVNLSTAVNRISASNVGIYPPGIPLIIAGEYIKHETITLLQQTSKINCFGIKENQIRVLCT